jgi:hypothetical protein
MKGEVVCLCAFDVANEIITPRVREILSEKPFPFEIRMDRTLPGSGFRWRRKFIPIPAWGKHPVA